MARQRDALTVSGVVGDVVDPFTQSVSLRVTFSNKVFTNGCAFRPPQLVNPPRVDVGGEDLRTFYTLVLVDPDAPNPSDPTLREYLHWLVTDIPATTGATFGCIYIGQEVMHYEPPSLSLVGIHRFVFVLFRQLGRQTVYAPAWRQNFVTREFARIYNLGPPVASIYLTCQKEPAGRRR